MTIYNLNFVKELVNAFNISNYGSEVNTNFVIEGDNIIVKFNCDQDSADRYLSQMARGLVREYFPDEYVAGHFFDLTSLPFNFDKGEWTSSEKVTKLTVPIDSGVIFNLKVHFAEESEIDVKNRMIKAIDEKYRFGKKHIEELLNENIKAVSVSKSSHYIKCLLFNQPNVQMFFVRALRVRMEEHGYNYSDFYHVDGNKIYFKDVENIGFISSVTEIAKKRAGYHFRFPSSDDLKVRKYKDAIGELIFHLARIPICGYFRDNFIDRSRISNGDNFAFIPVVEGYGGLRYLSRGEADKISAQFSYDLFTNVRDQTEGTRSGEFGEVYAFSDRQIALLIPVIIGNSVINKDGQLEVNPELFEQLRSQSPSTGMSDAELESPKHNQEKQMRKSPRRGSKREAGGERGMLSQAELELRHAVNSSNQPQQSLGAATVGTDESVQGASGGSRKLSFSDKAKKYASRVMERLKFRRNDKRRASVRSAPEEESVSEKLFASPTRSLPGTVRESSPLLEDSPVRLVDITWPLPEVTVEETSSMSGNNLQSSDEHEDKNQQLRPKASVSRNGSNRSSDSGFKSADPSPQSSFDAVALTKLKQQYQGNEVVAQAHL